MTRSRADVLVVALAHLALAGSLAACGGDSAAPAAGARTSSRPTVTEPAPSSTVPTTIGAGATGTVALGERPFALHVPPSYDPAVPTALLVALHGWGGTGEAFVDRFQLTQASDERGFLLAVPDGTTDPDGRQFWNATDACCDAYGSGVDDSAYLADVIDEVAAGYAVDRARVWVTGISSGGFMAHRMACDHADRVTAIASFSGAQTSDARACAPSRALSVLEVHGTADEDVRVQGGVTDGARYPSLRRTMATWRLLDGCVPGRGAVGPPLDADAALPGAETVRTSWSPCDRGSEVSLWRVDGGGHVPDVTPALTAALVDWLEAHARRR